MWLTRDLPAPHLRRAVLSPVGLSAMTKLAPVRIAGLVMGVWFLATSVGNYIGGRVSGLYESLPLPSAVRSRWPRSASCAGLRHVRADASRSRRMMGRGQLTGT